MKPFAAFLMDCLEPAELEILADGLHLVLIDPYNEPKLKVRYPHSGKYEEVRHKSCKAVSVTPLISSHIAPGLEFVSVCC